MTATEQEILDNLRHLERAAGAMTGANPKPDLRPIFTRLEELARRLPASTGRDLRHFLERKSYQKARALLEGRDS
jgi:hypothetical protein